MAAPATNDEFLDLIRKSGVAEEKRFDAWLQKAKSNGAMPPKPAEVAGLLVHEGVLTKFQAEQILQGKWKRFTIGKYKVLESLGSGGMGSVYLCEHKLMRRRVAVKVLPTAKAQDESALQRFYREARAVAALDHPNIVHAYDIDQDATLHFLVMEYVDGASLQDIVKKSGPMDIERACHYIRQATLGLEHAHEAGLIHRDIKPGNILVDRTGVVKILDMGLARFFNDDEDVLTKKFDENVLGTADYLAPEQAIDSHTVDIRADIYSLGATFYYMLTGRTPFGEGTVAQKLLWHQNRQPKPVTEFRPEVSPALSAIVSKMMAKDLPQRYQTPAQVAEALEPFTQTPIGPPPEAEMPHLSPAATGPTNVESPTAVVKSNTPPQPTQVPKALQGMSSKAKMAPSAPASPRPQPAPTPPPARAPAASMPSPAPQRRNPPTPPPAPQRRNPPTPPPATKPASAPSRPAVQAVAENEAISNSIEEEAPWESFSSVDTEDASAKGDTSPQGAKSARALAARKGAVKNPRRAKLVFLVMGVAALLVAGGVVWYLMFYNVPPTPVTRRPLDVIKDGSIAKSYRSILQALRAAQPGDVIQLHDPEHVETLLVELPRMSGEITSDVTIQAAPGKDVVWRPASKDETKPIVWLQNARNFKINGERLTFDGAIDAKKRVQNLIVVNFASPGLAIENATLKSFGRSAINIVNVAGTKKEPVRLGNLTTITTPPETPQASILFEANPDVQPPFNDHFIVAESQFQGIRVGIKKDNTDVGSNIIWPK